MSFSMGPMEVLGGQQASYCVPLPHTHTQTPPLVTLRVVCVCGWGCRMNLVNFKHSEPCFSVQPWECTHALTHTNTQTHTHTHTEPMAHGTHALLFAL